jgi:hypothetical protein
MYIYIYTHVHTYIRLYTMTHVFITVTLHSLESVSHTQYNFGVLNIDTEVLDAWPDVKRMLHSAVAKGYTYLDARTSFGNHVLSVRTARPGQGGLSLEAKLCEKNGEDSVIDVDADDDDGLYDAHDCGKRFGEHLLQVLGDCECSVARAVLVLHVMIYTEKEEMPAWP